MKETNIFTVDVEEWHQAFIKLRNQNNKIDRLSYVLPLLLDLLEEYDIKATFFVVANLCEKHKNLIKRILTFGHEIAMHGYDHIPLYYKTRQQIKKETAMGKKKLEDIIGREVIGYRAPWFSIVEKNFYVLDILLELGFKYDSSIFPIKTSFYGIDIKQIKKKHKNILTPNNNWIEEYYIKYFNLGFFKIPLTGGFYFRNIPLILQKIMIRYMNKKEKIIFYCHPWEFDFNHPAFNSSIIERIIHSLGKKNYRKRLKNFIKNYNFISIKNYRECKSDE